MTLIPNAESMRPAELWSHIKTAWHHQRRHVAEHSGFYRALWGGEAPPEDLRDLPALPLSDKAQLRVAQAAHPPFGDYLAAPPRQAVRLHRTSGTDRAGNEPGALGTGLCGDAGGRRRSHRAAGLTPDHTVVHCLNYQMWMGGVTDHMTLEATGALVVPFGVGATERLIRTIREVGIDAISCTPSYPAVLERVLAERFPGLTPRDLGLKLGLFGGEPGLDDPAFRSRLARTWGIEPRNANYGVSDVFSNFAAQCEHDTRLHFLAGDVLYPELIAPESGDPLPLRSGQTGELVLTHLVRDCQPLVRFRTGDIVAVDATEPCACGRTGFRFRVVGRSDDMVVVRGLKLFPSMVAGVIGQFELLSGDYRIVLDSPPPHDALPVTVELARGQEAPAGLADAVAAAIKREPGATARVTIVSAGSFPVTEAKTRRVERRYT